MLDFSAIWKAQSQIHFEETIVQLRKLYKSYLAHESQHGKAVKSHADVLALLETGDKLCRVHVSPGSDEFETSVW